MTAFETGQSSMPTIYVNGNGLCFVKICRRRWEEAKVRHLSRSEALRFADHFHLAPLREALSRAVETT